MAAKHFPFVKGHGTQNDFLVIPDPDGTLDLHPRHVQQLCDRRTGLGADGVLRAVRSAFHPDAHAMAAEAEWFMDYWNPDGTQAQMCGNGIRLFSKVLAQEGHVVLSSRTALPIATRAGVRHVRSTAAAPGWITVAMGQALLPGPDTVTVHVGKLRWPAVHVDMGNPHAVIFVDNLDHAGSLATPPAVTPTSAYPHGVTVEFVVRKGPRHLAMRVHERGAGETRSCGTGACAAVAAVLHRAKAALPVTGDTITFIVDVPGGRLLVTVHPDAAFELSGPAEIVAAGVSYHQQP
ncbi:diaminopimelate epimerase [Streptomyces vinaceus]|uniref:diaminopimelate epimerase n=1 Tax=Streptomyces vinaceus TaxID=1960 RepID=UPI00380952C0